MKRKFFQFLILFILISAFSIAEVEKKHLTIERIFSDPRLEGTIPRNIEWAPDNSKFAFLWNDIWTKNLSLWLYDIKTKKLSEILSADNLEKESILSKEEEQMRTTMRIYTTGLTSFSWSPDSKLILIPYNSDLYIYDLQMKKINRITKTATAELDPKFCGSSEKIVFVRDNDLWMQNLKTGQSIQLTQTGSKKILNGLSNYIALEELNRYSSFECSEDGKMIAYVQSDLTPIRELIIPNYLPRFVEYQTQERPVAGEFNAIEKIAVIDTENYKESWIELPYDDYYVISIEWFDKNLLFRILERNNKVLHLYLYNPNNKTLEQLLLETDQAWVNIHNNFLKKMDGGFFWTSESLGYNHLYYYKFQEKQLKRLTGLEWEITEIHGLNQENKVFFSGNKTEPAQNHLFSLNLKTGELLKLTEEEGWHSVKFSSDFNYYIDLFSNSKVPPRLYLISIKKPDKKTLILDTKNPELNEYSSPIEEYIKIKSRDNSNIYCNILKPSSFRENLKYPAIIYVHGAGYAQAVKKQFGGIIQLFHQYLTEELNFIVVIVDYRGSSGYGRKWRTDVYLNLGGKDLEDIEDVVNYLKKLPYIDKEKLGIWGWSYGGFLTNMAMMKTPDLFKVGVAVAPVNDWRNYDTQYTEERLSTPQLEPEAYKKSSPIYYAKNLKNKLLIIHGMADDNVHFQDTVQLINELIENKIDFDLMIYPEGKHGISKDSNRIHLFKKIASYLAFNLSNETKK